MSDEQQSTAPPADENTDKYYFVKLSTELRYGTALAELRGAPLSVLIAIGLHVNRQDECWPGIDTLMRLTGYKRRQVRRAIRQLESMGIVYVQRGKNQSGQWVSNRYRIFEYIRYGRGNRRREKPKDDDGA